MGCFNVSCGISKITIREGERAFILPLEINPMNSSKELFPTTQFLYPTDYYVPFCFPIEGKYDDYGSLEDIVENEHTKILEKKLKINIKDFVSLLTESRKNVFDDFSLYHKKFFKNKEILKDSYTFEKFLEELGLEKIPEGYIHNETNVVIIENESSWTLNKKENEKIIPIDLKNISFAKYYEINKESSLETMKDCFLNLFKLVTNVTLGLKNLELYEKMINLSGMFIHGEVYDFITKEGLNNTKKEISLEHCDEFFFKHFGFEKISSTDGTKIYKKNEKTVTYKYNSVFIDKSKKDCSYVEDFYNEWKKKTKEDLNVKEILTEDYIWNSAIFYLNLQKDCMMKVYGKKEYLKHIDLNYIKGFTTFKDFKSLINIYKNGFIEGLLKKEYFELKNLVSNIYETNTLFFPTFQGIQGGNTIIERNFYSKINEIVNKRYKEE